MREDTRYFASHWAKEDGSEISGRTVEAWEQGRRQPSLFIRQHMSRVLYRLRNIQGRTIRMPSEDS